MSNTNDNLILEIIRAQVPSTIDDVLGLLRLIDQVLPERDGLKWFNLLYLMVTDGVNQNPPAGGWQNPAWLGRLDVVFAKLYLAALEKFITAEGELPSAWKALFEARSNLAIDRVQFALAGINAHINRDLALALEQTNHEMGLAPDIGSPEHDDFVHVNGILENTLPRALEVLATGIVGEVIQDTGKIGKLLAIWNVSVAREAAWSFEKHLRPLNKASRIVVLRLQDRLTGVVSRTLLLPIQ